MTGSSLAAEVRLRLPEGWAEVPLDAGVLRGRLDEAVPDDPAARAVLRTLLTRMLRQGEAAGVQLAAWWRSEVPAGGEDAEGGGWLLAAVTVSAVSAEALGGVPSAALLRVALERRRSRLFRPIEEPAEALLSSLQAVRQAGLLRQSAVDDGPPLLIDRFAIPVAGRGVALLDFSTPNLALAEGFRPLFADIAQSVEIRPT